MIFFFYKICNYFYFRTKDACITSNQFITLKLKQKLCFFRIKCSICTRKLFFYVKYFSSNLFVMLKHDNMARINGCINWQKKMKHPCIKYKLVKKSEKLMHKFVKMKFMIVI